MSDPSSTNQPYRALPPQWREIRDHVLAPFIGTRIALLLVGWWSVFFPASPNYPLSTATERGWHFSPYRLLDIWGRWDTGWYMSIAKDGYMVHLDHTQQQTNLPFFPLYPMLVRAFLWLVPDGLETDGMILLIGVIVANLSLLGAIYLLYCLAKEISGGDQGIAQRTVLYLLYFPTAFFLSCFYTDATFLLLSVAALYAAQRRQWVWAAIAAGLLSLTRPLGVVMTPILLWFYLSAIGWQWRQIRVNVLWLGLAPLPFLLYLGWLGWMTGDWLAPINAQQPFFRGFAWPWQTLIEPINAQSRLISLEQFFVVGFLIVAIVSFWRLPNMAYGLWVIGLIMPFLFTGTLTSALRYILVAAPVFIVLAQWGKHALVDRLLQPTFFALQIMLMVAWSQFYFI